MLTEAKKGKAKEFYAKKAEVHLQRGHGFPKVNVTAKDWSFMEPSSLQHQFLVIISHGGHYSRGYSLTRR